MCYIVAAMRPTRRQKRWSGRLRTAGALLGMLGAVALADHLLDLASPQRASSVFAHTGAPAALGIAVTAAGVALYALGRRWSR
ncbi:MAG: hypothetical protein D6689_10120 [Deltaproteobacteria bacterium]|nr:MAG: hypothetical protein D6689_10120 [Deltaproteobacteria bacterium]